MGYIFISYSRRDSQFVDTLVYRLESSGIQVWVDRSDIQGGSKWRSEIVKAIEGAESVILVLSLYSIQSDNVRKELDIAESQKAKIIPLEIEPVALPPDFKYQLAGIQRISFRGNFDTAFSQLLVALRKSPISNQRVRYQPAPAYSAENYTAVVNKYAQVIHDKSIYFLTAIPEQILVKVYQHYAGNALARNEIPLCLVDGKSYNSGKFGIFITNRTIYWRDSVINSGKSIGLNTIVSIESFNVFGTNKGGIKVNNQINIYRSDAKKNNLRLIASMIQELAGL